MSLLTGSPVYTFNLFGFDETFTYTGSVVSVDATATAIALGSNDAGMNGTVTFGEWAQVTPPPGHNSGVFDGYISVNPDVETLPATDTAIPTAIASYKGAWDTFSIHCAVTDATIATVCTISDIAGPGVTPEVTAVTEPVDAPTSDAIYATPVAVIITAGAEKLASFDSASGVAAITSASGSAPSPHSTSKSGAKTTDSASKTSSALTGTSSTAAATAKGGAASTGVSISAVAVLGLVASLFVL